MRDRVGLGSIQLDPASAQNHSAEMREYGTWKYVQNLVAVPAEFH